MTSHSGRPLEHDEPKDDISEEEPEIVGKNDDGEDEVVRLDRKAAEVFKVGQTDQKVRTPAHCSESVSIIEKAEARCKETGSMENANEPAENDSKFEVQFDGVSDEMHPYNKSSIRKWSIVLILANCSLCVTCASALYTTTYAQLEPAFGIGREAATLGLTTFVMGLACGPLFLSPLSEFYGRRWIYICSYGLFTIWLIPCAVARNFATMLVSRFFDGLAGSAFLSVAGGTVGDLFPKDRLSMPMMVYSASPFVGPPLGPLLGGFINYYTDWRWSFYVLIIWAGAGWVLLIFFVPETYGPVILRHKARLLRKQTEDPRWKAPIEIMDKSVTRTVLWSCIRPFELSVLEPMCLNLNLLSALLLGIIYLFFGAFPIIFTRNYGFNTWQNGLTFMGIFVGNFIGVCCDPLFRKNYDRLVRNNGGVSEPEFRLPPTIVGAIIVPIGLFGFAWTSYKFVHWIVPIIFSSLFGLGLLLAFSGIYTFLVEAYPLYAASALAANAFTRAVFAASFPLFGVQMYNTLGFQWASSLLGFIAVGMAPFPYLFFKIGKRIRKKSRFASDNRR